MAYPLQVEDQMFAFGDTWVSALKYDDTDFYQNKIKDVLPHTKAVDLLAVHPIKGLLLLEAKDFRGHRIPNKQRLVSGELAIEVALKVKDTVAGVMGSSRSRIREFEMVGKHVISTEKLIVVLWLEDDTSRNILEWKGRLDVINQKIKEKLAWLGPVRTYVLSSQTENKLPDLTVTNLKKS